MRNDLTAVQVENRNIEKAIRELSNRMKNNKTGAALKMRREYPARPARLKAKRFEALHRLRKKEKRRNKQRRS